MLQWKKNIDALNIYCSTRSAEFFQNRAYTRKYATRVLHCRKKRRTTRAASTLHAQEALKNFPYICVIVATRRIWSHFDVVPEERHKSLQSISRQSLQIPRRPCACVIIACRRCCGCRGRHLDYYTHTHLRTLNIQIF